MARFNSTFVRSALASALATAALSLTACGPQSAATPNGANAPAGLAQQQQTPYPGTTAPPPPDYAVNRVTQPSNAQPAPAPQAYAPPTQVVQRVAAAPAPRAVNSATHGEISSIEPIRSRPQGSGAGAVIGGVLGAVVGNHFGHGNGRAALTVIGAGGGAVAGNNVERNMHEGVTGYRISVHLDNGESRTYEESQLDGLRVGDRVHVEGHRLVRT